MTEDQNMPDNRPTNRPLDPDDDLLTDDVAGEEIAAEDQQDPEDNDLAADEIPGAAENAEPGTEAPPADPPAEG